MAWSIPAEEETRRPGDLVVVTPERGTQVVLTRIYPNNTLAESHSIDGPVFVMWLGQRGFDMSIDWNELDVVLWNSAPHAVLRGNVNDVNT